MNCTIASIIGFFLTVGYEIITVSHATYILTHEGNCKFGATHEYFIHIVVLI